MSMPKTALIRKQKWYTKVNPCIKIFLITIDYNKIRKKMLYLNYTNYSFRLF